jgi:predicted Zn-dependent protease
MGRTFMGAGYTDAAELILTYAWRNNPEFGVAPGLLATIYDQQGRYVEAEEVSRMRLAEDSTDAVQYHLLSRALERQGRFREAGEARRASIRHGEGEHWEQWVWLARLELAAGDTAGAWAAVDSARQRVLTPDESRQIDSLALSLGGGGPGLTPPDSANNSQNPRPDPRTLPK